MSNWKQPNLLSRNKDELNACILILDKLKKEGEDSVLFAFKTNDNCRSLVELKGIIIASVGISNTVFGEDYKVMLIDSEKVDQQYRIASKNFQKNYIISVVLPLKVPENILQYVINEFIEYINFFFENLDEAIKCTDMLKKFGETLIYNVTNYALSKMKEDFLGSPLSVIPIVTMTYSYNELIPCCIIKPPLNDTLRTELIEMMNTLNADKSVIQETLTLMEPPFYVKGYTLLYRGYVVFNTLHNLETINMSRLAMIHDMYERSNSSGEILMCEFLYENEQKSSFAMKFNNFSEERKKILTTILAQREFVLMIHLDIIGKLNSSFDPFFHKRAEDLLITILKRGYNVILNNEINIHSIKAVELKSNEFQEKIIRDVDSECSKGSENTKKDSKKNLPTIEKVQNSTKLNTQILNSKISGYIDKETNVNIIHFALYDDSDCVINTTDLNMTPSIFQDVYKEVFSQYAKIQSNINKLKIKNKNIRVNHLFNNEEIYENYKKVYKSNNTIKMKIIRENFLKNINNFKLFEYAIKINVENQIPIWVCCKLYEHISVDDETNFDEYSNNKIIYMAYESHNPINIDNFCQDLLLYELYV